MAYDYNKLKQQYEGLNDQQKQQFAEMNKNDTSGNYQKFMDQYNAEKSATQNNSGSNFTNQNDKNGQNQANFETPTINKSENQNETPKVIPSEDAQRAYQIANDYLAKRGYDTKNNQVSPDLDQSKFGESTGQIRVQEGTAQQTGKPDYQADTEARNREITDNLNYYWQNNRDFFTDRDTFNNIFHYSERNDSQKKILDSYWKKKEDMDYTSQFTSGESIYNGMNNGKITADQLNYIKENNEDAYRQYQQLQEEQIKLRIINDIVPPLLEDISNQLQGMMNSLGIQPQDALDIEEAYYGTMDRLNAYQDLENANNTVRKIEEVNDKKTAIMNRYANNAGGTVSDALAAARMAKALAPYNEQMQGLQYQYQDYANLYNQKLATANQAAQVRQAQAQENQRVWNQRLTALGFAADALSYRTPEQQAQLKLQTQQALNEMDLLQQSKLNDINRYNAYATAKLNNQLQSELTDLSVTDPTQLRANLNNVLSSYYSQWGDIIQRPQSQVVDDVIAYAKKNGISVAQALRENFIEPLQNKQEYKNKIATSYAAPTSTTSAGYSKITINGKDYLTIGGKIIDPADLGLGGSSIPENAKPYNLVSTETMESGIDAFSVGKNQDDYYGECGKFVNDYLVSIGVTDANNRYFGNETIETRKQRCNSQTAAKGAVAVFDYGIISSDNKNHGHVAVVTQTYADGSFDVIESNYPGGGKINVKRHVEKNDANLKGFINPSLGYSTSQGYNTKDPYSGVSGYTSTGKEINNGGWITSLEKSFERWDKLTDKQRGNIEKSYGIDTSEFNEQMERYMDYVETTQLTNSILDARKMLIELKKRADDEANEDLKGPMDLDIAEKGYGNSRQRFFTSDDAYNRILKGKSLFDMWSSNAMFTKYLEMVGNGAKFGVMTDSEWNKIKESTTSVKWEQDDEVFRQNIDDNIKRYDEVLAQLGYDIGEESKPETADQIEIIPEQGITNSGTITMIINGKKMYSDDGGKTRY